MEIGGGGGGRFSNCAHIKHLLLLLTPAPLSAHAHKCAVCARAHDAGNMCVVNAYAYIWYMLDNYRPPLVHVLPWQFLILHLIVSSQWDSLSKKKNKDMSSIKLTHLFLPLGGSTRRKPGLCTNVACCRLAAVCKVNNTSSSCKLASA